MMMMMSMMTTYSKPHIASRMVTLMINLHIPKRSCSSRLFYTIRKVTARLLGEFSPISQQQILQFLVCFTNCTTLRYSEGTKPLTSFQSMSEENDRLLETIAIHHIHVLRTCCSTQSYRLPTMKPTIHKFLLSLSCYHNRQAVQSLVQWNVLWKKLR